MKEAPPGMTFAQEIAPPAWVNDGAQFSAGLDLLGLRAPAMRIGNALLDGITTVTPSVRYLSLVCWITKAYWERRGLNARKEYSKFARTIESAVVLGNLLVDPGVTGLVGANEAKKLLEGTDPVSLDSHVQTIASTIYSGAAEQLGLISLTPSAEVPHLTDSRGMRLAEVFGESIRTTTLGRLLFDSSPPSSASRDDLRELGQAMGFRDLPSTERDVLLLALMPPEPIDFAERARLATYATLLALADQRKSAKSLPRRSLLDAASDLHRRLPSSLTSFLDNWALYLVRDLLAVVHEYALSSLLGALREECSMQSGPVESNRVIRAALLDGDEQGSSLQDLGLLEEGEAWEDLPFNELRRRVDLATSKGAVLEAGLLRWEGGIQEAGLIRVARAAGRGVLSLLPVAWLMVIRRVENGIVARDEGFDLLSRQPFERLGIEQNLLPWRDQCSDSNLSLQDVVADLSERTVAQHLRTAWSRLAVDARKDVALLVSDGQLWYPRGEFRPGRTNSRLDQATGWLNQLELLNSEGLTPRGQEVLDGALEVLGLA